METLIAEASGNTGKIKPTDPLRLTNPTTWRPLGIETDEIPQVVLEAGHSNEPHDECVRLFLSFPSEEQAKEIIKQATQSVHHCWDAKPEG